ncbi:MAG: ABC transporter permease [Actinobacteria bacterium]|nr:ABC transporter permease [Actinomycetota bacterium]
MRGRLAGAAVLAILVGLSAGMVTAAVAGARRTDSSVRRFLAFHRPTDMYVGGAEPALQAVLRLPQVADAESATYVSLSASPDGADPRLTPFAAGDEHAFRTMDRILLVAGHLAAPAAPFDIVINEKLAANRHLRLGSVFRMYGFSLDQNIEIAATGSFADAGAPAGRAFDLRIVGIGRVPTDVRQQSRFDELAWFTPAFVSAYADSLGVSSARVLQFFDPAPSRNVRLHRGPADLKAFAAVARPLLGPDGVIASEGSDAVVAAAAAQRSIHLQALALAGFAGVAMITALVILGQVLARREALDAADRSVLIGLGMTKSQLVGAAVCRNAVVAAAGSVVTVAVAIALSPVFPVGLARRAEINPGPAFDTLVLIAGALVTLVLVIGGSALAAAWPHRRRTGGPASPPRAVATLSRLGLPVPATVGIRMSLERRSGPAAVPMRGAMVATAAAVATVTAALTFAASLGHLVNDRHEQGWNWDVLVGNPNSQGDAAALASRLASRDDVAAAAGLSSVGPIEVAGKSVAAVALEDVKGSLAPTVLEGRAPTGTDEVALASATLRALHQKVGGAVAVAAGRVRRKMLISGRIVFPAANESFGSSLSRGAVITGATARVLFGSLDPAKLYGVRFRPGNKAASLAELRRDFGDLVDTANTPQDIDNLRRIAWMPRALAGLVVFIGGAALAHSLLTALRRRRRDMAVLKTLGFVRRQVGALVAWQATTITGLALVLGVPLGVAAGRWGWSLVAAGTGTGSSAQLPAGLIVIAMAIALLGANLIAAGPGWVTARVRPAAALRAE